MVKRFNPQWGFHPVSQRQRSFTMVKLLPSLSSSSFHAKSAVLLTRRSNGLWWHARGTGTPGGRRGSRAQSKCNAMQAAAAAACVPGRPAGGRLDRWMDRSRSPACCVVVLEGRREREQECQAAGHATATATARTMLHCTQAPLRPSPAPTRPFSRHLRTYVSQFRNAMQNATS